MRELLTLLSCSTGRTVYDHPRSCIVNPICYKQVGTGQETRELLGRVPMSWSPVLLRLVPPGEYH